MKITLISKKKENVSKNRSKDALMIMEFFEKYIDETHYPKNLLASKLDMINEKYQTKVDKYKKSLKKINDKIENYENQSNEILKESKEKINKLINSLNK